MAVGKRAAASGVAVHMPRIGTGQAGGVWDVVVDLVKETICAWARLAVIYTLPNVQVKRDIQPTSRSFGLSLSSDGEANIPLSGPISAGKNACAGASVTVYSVLRTQDLIRSAESAVPNERAALQRAGELLDRRTKGRWVGQALSKLAPTLPLDSLIIVDSVE
jgi:hypothetical protein